MFAAIVSLIGLTASILLGVREWRRRASAGSAASAPVRDGLAAGVVFCTLQIVVAALGFLGLAPDDIPSPIIVNIIFTACAFASFGRDRVLAVLERIVQTKDEQLASERTFRPDCAACPKYDECAIRIPRDEDRTRLARLGGKLRSACHAAAQFLRRPASVRTIVLMIAGVFALLALETPSNHDLTWAYPLCILLEWSIITAIMMGVYYLFQRRGTGAGIVAFVFWGIGMAEYFVITFKSMPISPADISALGTAAAVGGGYVFIFSAFGLYAMGLLAISLLFCSIATEFRTQPRLRTEFAEDETGGQDADNTETADTGKAASENDISGEDIAPSTNKDSRKPRNRKLLISNLFLAFALLGGVVAHVTLIDYYHTLNITVYTWRPLESYYRQGFIPTFISSAQTIKPPVPEDYSVEGAAELLEQMAARFGENVLEADATYIEASKQFEEEKPVVIAIMNETFSDLSIYQNMHADYQGPQFFKSLNDCLGRGTLYVSAYGGGTCNTEFEFLTGNSMAMLGSGVYPYTIYDLRETENLASQFKGMGYHTVAMHPNHATNWNRENVYGGFGFDEFLAIQDFQGSDTLRGMVTDEATYDEILELIENDPEPQFIFDVTMQNHSGYETGLLPSSVLQQYYVDGVADPEINEFLSLIEESDRALEKFIGELRKLDRKVVVVFFGDHQPYFPNKYNDQWFTGEDGVTHAERLWQTSYIVWANYDVAGADQTSTKTDLSTNYLAAETLRLIGAPLTDYQKAQLSLRDSLPVINTTGFQDRTGTWYLSNSGRDALVGPNALAAATARDQLATIQYYKLFGDGKDVYTKQFQSAANETDPNLAPGTTQIK